ncbi:MAG: hypothetical protein FJ295_04545 [Planctomycetes bacterium]|nr:hypothetical protein [Planctomycetota bacterium]
MSRQSTRLVARSWYVPILWVVAGWLIGRWGIGLPAAEPPADRSPRLHQIQVLGTHNSYHVEPDAAAMALIRLVVPREADANAYSHRPLDEQLDRLGLRLFELDLYRDDEGGKFARPLAYVAAQRQGADVAAHDPQGVLLRRGIKILHSPDFDFRTTVYALQDALRTMRAWSLRHAGHLPLFVLLELKQDSYSPLLRPVAWDLAGLQTLEKEILEIVPREMILAPDDVRGAFDTLRDAVRRQGWPRLREARGKIVFLLDNEDAIRDAYLRDDATLRGRLMFTSVGSDHPAAAWMKRNDPDRGFDEIQSLVRAGFLVRTRADEGTAQARSNDAGRRDRALASGAQLISTDFPEPDPRYSDYAVTYGGECAARPNPVVGAGVPADLEPKRVESSADRGDRSPP